MHSNEVKINQDNREILIQEAEKLGERYVAALNEQIERQSGKK